MSHRGLMFYTTLIVLGSAMLASQALRQRRAAYSSHGRKGRATGQSGAPEERYGHPSASPDLDTSITSRSIPP